MACPNLDKVLEWLWPSGVRPQANVWAVLDAARDPRIFPLLRDSGVDYLCLFSGVLPGKLRFAAPYIVELRREHLFTRRLLDLAWGNSWGICLSIQDSSNLRPHLRRFLRVRTERGKFLLFRYYDPRVMRVYLPTCLRDELNTLFGPVTRYLVEGEGPETLIEFSFDGLTLIERSINLVQEGGNPPSLPAERKALPRSLPDTLVIRERQMDVFRQPARKRFEDQMVESIAVDFPPKYELLGEAGLRALIRKAIATGHARGIRNQGAVAVLIELMVQFGEQFEYSPDRQWAEKILSHPTLPDYVRVDAARQRMMARTQGRTLMPWTEKQRQGRE